LLLEHIQYENLSHQSIHSFIDSIDELCKLLSFTIWSLVSRHRFMAVPVDLLTEPFVRSFDLTRCHSPETESGQFDVIISYLRKKECGRTRFAVLCDATNSWICHDFRDMLIALTCNAIRSRRKVNSIHLRAWRMEGSVDGDS
jgi:hypothetical protein